jgi:hypothetical protein
MEFSIIRLGQDVFFESNQRTQITDKEFKIESSKDPQGYVLTHRKSLKRHFISIYNVAYAEIKEEIPAKEEVLETSPEGENVEPTTATSETPASENTSGKTKRAGKKKPDQY